MTEIERRRALAESLQEAMSHPLRRASDIRAAAERARFEAMQRRRKAMVGLLVLVWGALGWIWAAQPAWVFSPSMGIAAETRFTEEEGLRYGMFLQASRIREFQLEFGRLPESIQEAGEAEEGLSYVVSGDRWTLTGTAGGRPLVLTSDMSPEAFLQVQESASR